MNGVAQSLPLGAEPSVSATEQRAVSSWPSYLLAFAATCIAVGIRWDISWHQTIGRDTFWTPAHMVIYLGGTLGGCIGGWLAIQHTFLATQAQRERSVRVFGARAPLGAWVAIWGATAMLTSGPFDNWWHNAYGLDVKIISPPHALLGLGMLGISFGALLLVLSRQNQMQDGRGSGLFIYVGGIVTVLGGVFVMEYSFPNLQHTAIFYKVCSMMFVFRLVAIGCAARTSFPMTRVALVYLLIECLFVWILPLFPGQPRLAPIYNPVTHMVPPPFPLLLVVPAVVMDLVLNRVGGVTGCKRVALAIALGGIFLALFIPTQWWFAKFLISPAADNWFFAGNRTWSYGSNLGDWTHQFWRANRGDSDRSLLTPVSVLVTWLIAAISSWLALLLGGWMRKVQR